MPISVYFLVLGILLLGLGLRRLKGPVSVSFLASSPYMVMGAYSSIPFSLTCLIWSFTFSPFVPEAWRLWLFLTGGAIGFAGPFAFMSIEFLKPPWLQWLEAEHSKLIPFLSREIQEIGYRTWDQQINTEEEFKNWVEKVRRKYYGPLPDDRQN